MELLAAIGLGNFFLHVAVIRDSRDNSVGSISRWLTVPEHRAKEEVVEAKAYE